MNVSIALGIPHTPWRPERVESLTRLRDQLGLPRSADHRSTYDDLLHSYRLFYEREPNYVWSQKLWTWAAESRASHLLQLQDDVIVATDLARHLRAMIDCVPDQVIGLETAHPKGAEVDVNWYTTPDMLIGVGYVVPISLLREFLEWRGKLRKGAVESVSEDTLIGVWTLSTGRRIWHPVPTIIDHDVSLPSTYGNDHHGHRKPTVTWRDRPIPSKWRPDADHLPRFYAATPRLARRWIVGATEEDYQRWLAL